MKANYKRILIVAMLVLASATLALAHKGRTDSSGGHRDKNNVSGLGSYHYHCGGKPAHLHNGGVCPYAKKQTPAPAPKPKSK